MEMRRLPNEQTELPDTSYDEDIPLLSGFTYEDDKPAMLDREKELISGENFRKSTSANLALLASAKKEMKLKKFHLGQSAVIPTFARKAIRACWNHSPIDSKILSAQNPKISLQRGINRSGKKDNDFERRKNNYEKWKDLPSNMNK